jgi:aminopeptidase N
MLALRESVERFEIVGLAAEPVPSLLRGFSAPVIVRYPYTDTQLTFLMAHDSDGFNRWDAAQSLSVRLLLQLVAEPGTPVPEAYLDAVRGALAQDGPDADRALLAEVLTLPSESYLGDQMTVVDVDGIHRARERLAAAFGAQLRDDLLVALERNQEPGEYDLSPAAMGRRALRNCALGYLMRAPTPEIVHRCRAQFEAGHNMTDVIAALRCLLDADPEHVDDAGDAALAAFFERWSDDALVLDKWFALQAQSSRPDTLMRVEALLAHPKFSLTNPNRVRSLIGAFAVGNPLRFHAVDGAGYRFLADRIVELDPLNPQIASRLLYPMTRWRRYDDIRQALMRAQLERILEVEGLSNDVYEVVSKSLGQKQD